jgi:hypothetical protein
MSYVRREISAPAHPVLVVGLEGWIDAGFAAATAMATVLEKVATRTYASFPGDDLLDYRSRRPRLRIDDGVRTRISWPEPRLRVAVEPDAPALAVLVGPEPDFRWNAFAAEVTELAVEIDARLVVSLGAFPTATPHTRPVRLASTASESALAERVGFIPGSIDVPTGIADVIGAACAEVGIASVGLWARVPHYIAASPFPAAAIALLEGLAVVSGVVIDTGELVAASLAAIGQIEELIAQSADHTEMVRQLEEQYEETLGTTGLGGEAIPSGDEIAAELERYLRGEMG